MSRKPGRKSAPKAPKPLRRPTMPAGSIEDAPRLNIRATPADADRLLKNYESRTASEATPSLDAPYTPKWWE